MNYVTFFGGSMNGKSSQVINDPPRTMRIGNEAYELHGCDEYTWRYELSAAQKADA